MRRYRWWLICLALVVVGLAPLRRSTRAAEAAGSPDPRPVPRMSLAGSAISTVDNFAGFVGILISHGTGIDAHANPLEWDADLRFMQGTYVSRDGIARVGTFAFI